MSFALAAILVLTVSLAAANGSNDDAKGVATLAGAGVTRYRFAIAGVCSRPLPARRSR